MAKPSLILDPSISHKELFEKALNMDHNSRLNVLRQLDLYRAIYHWLGKIERPDFENDSTRMVRRKYVPNEKHDAFYRAAHTPEGKGRWLLGGNRSGKSESGIREDVAFSLGFRPWYKRSDSCYMTPVVPPTNGRIFCEDWEKAAKGIIVPKLFRAIPPELLVTPPRKNQMGIEAFWKIKVPFDATNKVSSIEIITNKVDVRSVEGWDGDWVHFDEPTRKNLFVAATRGLVDTDGYFWMTLTPLSEPWILDDIVLNHDYTGFHVTSYENIWNPETGSGFLTEAGIESFAKKLSEIEKKTRLYGEFAHLSGIVFDSFTPLVHVYPNDVTKLEDIPKSWWRDCFIDPGRRKPHCVIFVAWSPQGAMYVYDGFRIGDTRYADDFPDVIPAVPTATELIHAIDQRCQRDRGGYPLRFFVDPLADTPDWDTGTSLLDHLANEFPIEKWPKVEKESAIAPLKALMKPDPETARPMFFVHHMLTRAIYEIERYRWDEWSNKSVRKYKPKVIKEDDDYVDCMLAAAMCPPPDFRDDTLPQPTPYFRY